MKSDYIEIVILKNKMLNQAQQLQILAKRNPESQDQQAPSKSSSFGQYFTDLSRFGLLNHLFYGIFIYIRGICQI